MEHYDIGLMGCWWLNNYGSILTYYALQQVLLSMGKSVFMIDGRAVPPRIQSFPYPKNLPESLRFAYEHSHIAELPPDGRYSDLNQFCDCFMIGSDQTWRYALYNRAFEKRIYLDFADNEKKKIAYSVSLGTETDSMPTAEREKAAQLMARFDGISVREASGVRLLLEGYGIRGIQLLDPVFLADVKTVYEPLAEQSARREEQAFLAAYMLAPTPEKGKAILHIANKLGLKPVVLLDAPQRKFSVNQQKIGLPDCIQNLTTEDWLYYLRHARFIMTDSLHGTSFALLFHKNFISLNGRDPARLAAISSLFHFEHRIVAAPKRIFEDASLLEPVDYARIDRIMERGREQGLTWLREKLDEPKKSAEELRKENVICVPNIRLNCAKSVTERLDMELCTGCGACVSVCPKDALSLKPDAHGFYRSAVDYTRCVNCGQCTRICPALRLPVNWNSMSPACFAFYAAEPEVLQSSSSGGIFALLAREAFRRGGAVAGAAWTDDLRVEHILIDKPEELWKLQKSKYLQSYTGSLDRAVKERLDAGQFVLFSGVPCQVAGLHSFLGKDYPNLVTVDLFCHGTVSELFFRKYAEELPGKVKEYQFRYKKTPQTWGANFSKITTQDGQTSLLSGIKQEHYMDVYLSHLMTPPQCENCRYQRIPRFGDLTIGDFWGIQKRDPDIPKQGVSAILRNSDKGGAFLSAIPAHEIGLMKQVPLSWIGGNGYARKPASNHASPNRDKFYRAILSFPFSKAAKYATEPPPADPPSLSQKTPVLYMDANSIFFRYQPEFWEERFVDHALVLSAKLEQSGWGHYATLPLYEKLESGKTYSLKMKFKVHTLSDKMGFYIMNSADRKAQIIFSQEITPETLDRWLEVEKPFVPNDGIYDSFMIGARHVSGPVRTISFAYISIS